MKNGCASYIRLRQIYAESGRTVDVNAEYLFAIGWGACRMSDVFDSLGAGGMLF